MLAFSLMRVLNLNFYMCISMYFGDSSRGQEARKGTVRGENEVLRRRWGGDEGGWPGNRRGSWKGESGRKAGEVREDEEKQACMEVA